MADEDLQAELARLRAENETLRAENETLKQKRSSAVSMKVSEKGAVSVYGLGRFPVTLYQEQWQKLLALSDEIKAFIDENRSRLKVKE
jgi:regulator of replication initiation timing